MAAGAAREAAGAFFSLGFGGCGVRHCGSVFVAFSAPVGLLPASVARRPAFSSQIRTAIAEARDK